MKRKIFLFQFFFLAFTFLSLTSADPDEYKQEFEGFKKALGLPVPVFNDAQEHLQHIKDWWQEDKEGRREFKKAIARALGNTKETNDPEKFVESFLTENEHILQVLKSQAPTPPIGIAKKSGTIKRGALKKIGQTMVIQRVPAPTLITVPVINTPPMSAAPGQTIVIERAPAVSMSQSTANVSLQAPVQERLTNASIEDFVKLATQMIEKNKKADAAFDEGEFARALKQLFGARQNLLLLMDYYAVDEKNEQKIEEIQKTLEKDELTTQETIAAFLSKMFEFQENKRAEIEKKIKDTLQGIKEHVADPKIQQAQISKLKEEIAAQYPVINYFVIFLRKVKQKFPDIFTTLPLYNQLRQIIEE